MGIQLAQTPTYWAKVWYQYTTEQGARGTQFLDVQFKRIERDALEALSEQALTLPKVEQDVWFLLQLVAGWKGDGPGGVTGDKGEPLEFNEENFRRVLQITYTSAWLTAFWATLPKAKEKN